MSHLPTELSIAFGLTTLLTFILFRRAVTGAHDPRTQRLAPRLTMLIIAWLALQAVVSIGGFYVNHLESIPPRIAAFGVLPALIVIIVTFSTSSGRQFVDSLPMFEITALHTVRIFVELVLWWLFLKGAVPELMTFEGRNLDIIAGFTAPLVAYFGIVKKMITPRVILIWNVICLGLLFNIVIIALLSVPTPFQKLAFDQPNVGVLIFPISWLPTFVVPVVLFCHLVAFRQLMKRSKTMTQN
jgi:hypothetical protein